MQAFLPPYPELPLRHSLLVSEVSGGVEFKKYIYIKTYRPFLGRVG